MSVTRCHLPRTWSDIICFRPRRLYQFSHHSSGMLNVVQRESVLAIVFVALTMQLRHSEDGLAY